MSNHSVNDMGLDVVAPGKFVLAMKHTQETYSTSYRPIFLEVYGLALIRPFMSRCMRLSRLHFYSIGNNELENVNLPSA